MTHLIRGAQLINYSAAITLHIVAHQVAQANTHMPSTQVRVVCMCSHAYADYVWHVVACIKRCIITRQEHHSLMLHRVAAAAAAALPGRPGRPYAAAAPSAGCHSLPAADQRRHPPPHLLVPVAWVVGLCTGAGCKDGGGRSGLKGTEGGTWGAA
jgi:hypothetical protein